MTGKEEGPEDEQTACLAFENLAPFYNNDFDSIVRTGVSEARFRLSGLPVYNAAILYHNYSRADFR